MSTLPVSCSVMTDWALGIGTIVTCRPCRAKSPRSCAMYSPARSTAGIAATVTSGSSGLSATAGADADAAPFCEPHPAARIAIITPISENARKLRARIVALPTSRVCIPVTRSPLNRPE